MKLKRNLKGNENPQFSKPAPHKTRKSRHFTTASVLSAAVLAIATLTSPSSRAANILSNPGFETSPALTGWSIHTTETWSINGGNTAGKLYRTGANSLWTQGLYLNGGAPRYYNMYAYQKVAAAPGSTYTAEAWFSEYSSYYQHQGGDNGAGSGLLGSDGSGVEDCWVEVQFLDAANNILADYKSAIISPIDATLPGSAGVQTINVNTWPTLTNVITGVATNIYLDWIHCAVTNQFDISTIGPNTDPATESVTNTLGNGIMVAPPGTAFVQYMLCLAQAQYESGANYWDDCTLNQLGGPSASVISGLTPDGSKFFNTNTTLSFTVTSASTGGAPLPTNPTNGVTVIVNGVDKSATLQFSGYPTNLQVTMPGLASNSFYNVSITVSNSAGLLTTRNPAFDTLTPVFVVPVETFDYSGGQFIQNPIPTATSDPNSYFGRAGTFGIDMWTYNGTGTIPGGATTLAPNYPNRTDTNEAFEVSSDTQLPGYSGVPGVYNVDFSYNNAGNWYNYTRNPYPSGLYLVYARISGGQGDGSELLNLVTSGYGTTTQTTNNLGRFFLANGQSWTTYSWIPLTDSNGNLAPVNIPSGQQTLQLCSSPIAGENVISFIFVPLPAAGLPPILSNINPANGAVFAPPASGFSFTANAGTGGAPINTSGIHLTVNGNDVTSHLSISGTSTSWNVTYSQLVPNQVYTAIITVTNNNGVGMTHTVQFDTVDPNNFYVKGTDWDYSGGQWDQANNGLVPYVYFFNMDALTNIDFSSAFVSGPPNHYPIRLPGLAQEVTADAPLPGYATGNDYDCGYFNSGDWVNYTRDYPAGKYLAYGRLAGGNGNLTAYLDQVTSGLGTSNQTTRRFGTWRANTGGWQSWAWVPLTDTNLTSPVIVNVAGTNTLRVTSGGNVNFNYFMLIPVQGFTISAARSGNNIVVSFPTQVGVNYRVFYRPGVSAGGWTLLSTVAGDGTVKSVTDTTTAGTRYYKVTSP